MQFSFDSFDRRLINKLPCWFIKKATLQLAHLAGWAGMVWRCLACLADFQTGLYWIDLPRSLDSQLSTLDSKFTYFRDLVPRCQVDLWISQIELTQI